jgi:hypothetical protein
LNSTTVEIDGKQLPVVQYKEVLVVTTATLADMYGTDEVRVRQNYSNNKEKFTEGKHFFVLKGADLKDFKETHRVGSGYSVEISPRVNALALWTERGAARHAKMLDTDAAWEVFEKLEDAYFNKREPQPEPEITLEEILGEEPKNDAVFAAELKRVFDEHLALGYPKERAAVIAELIVSTEGEQSHRKSPRQHASSVVPFQGGETLVNNAELARRLGIPASDHAGAKRSIPYLLVAAGLLKSKGSPTLTGLGQKYGRRLRQDGNSGLRWVTPDTVEYLVEWRRKNNW